MNLTTTKRKREKSMKLRDMIEDALGVAALFFLLWVGLVLTGTA